MYKRQHIGITARRVGRCHQTGIRNHLALFVGPVSPILDVVDLTDWDAVVIYHIPLDMRQRRLLSEDIAAAWQTMFQRHRLHRQRMIFVDNLLFLRIYRNHLHLILHRLHKKFNLLFKQSSIILWSCLLYTSCRLTIGGKTKFVCIDGPEFDGAQVDWDEMFKRMGTFKDVEREEMEHFEEHLATVDAEKKKETTDITMDVEPTDAPIEELTDRNAEWRKELRASMKAKERTAIERVKMPELDPVYRARCV